MPSVVKSLGPSVKSKFYTDETSKEEKNMPTDSFYDQAAKETLRAAAARIQSQGPETPDTEGQPVTQVASHVEEPVVAESVEHPAIVEPQPVATPEGDDGGFDDFDFVVAYDDEPVTGSDLLLPENTVSSAIRCAFIGVGGAGGKLAKGFLDLGFHKTLLVNTTVKDQPEGVSEDHFLLIPGADGVGKDIALGKRVLENNSATVEDTIRTRIGSVDWLFVLAGGGGGTGSACCILQASLDRYLKSVGASGQTVYIVTKPTAQELLNPTITDNYESLMRDVALHPHILIDNEKQLHLLRGKVGMLDLYPSANRNFAKLFTQVLKLANENSPIQSFDSKDLERVLSTSGRMVIGSTVVRDVSNSDLGSILYQGCLKSSPCPSPAGKASTGAMLLIVTPEMASDPAVSRKLEAAFSYVGGRTDTLFSGVYVKQPLPGLIAISMIGGF